jgi:T5SS/PEP-CTERM-associated repeat protein/autotransporter-associated beta strand protein
MIRHFAGLGLHCVITLAVFVLGATRAPADVSTWNNGDGGNWSVSGNWVGGTPPVPGPTTGLVFGSPDVAAKSYTATNDIGSAAFDLNALTFNGNAGTLVTLKGLDNTANALNFTGDAPAITMGAGDATVAMATLINATMAISGGGGTLTFSNSLTSPANGVTLAKSFTGSLVLAGGGDLPILSVRAGTASATGGTLRLTAPTAPAGTDANGVSGLQLGAASGQTASFTASNGAIVNVLENVYIGDAAGSTGTVTVTGIGTVLSNTGGDSGRMGVGNFGNGTLNITDGGAVHAQRLFSSRQVGSTSTILVDGAGSTLHVTTQAAFGSNGPGTVTVQNGGSIVADLTFNLGNNAPGNGLVTVTGEGSSLTAFNPGIGATGQGTLTVKDGATATLTAHDPPGGNNFGLSIGVGANTTGTVNVQTNATVTVNGDATTDNEGQLVVAEGANSTGTLNIQSGGKLNLVGTLFAGTATNAKGTVNVTGSGSLLEATNLLIGGGAAPAGRGDLNVSAGANVTAENVTFAQDAQSSSTSVVDGATLGITDQLVIGQEGNASVTVRNGGSMTAGGNAFVGIAPGVTGAITVTGNGSSFTVGSQLQLGGAGDQPGGTAPLTVSAGGTASSGGFLVLFGGGSVNIDGGTVNAGSVVDGVDGTSAGTVGIGAGGVLNIVGTFDGAFSGVISGSGGITKSGDKFQILSGNNTYQGGTTVNAGSLGVAHAHALGTGGLTINGTGDVVFDSAANLGSAVRLASLTMAGGATPTGTFDVDDNKMIVAGGDVAAITALVKSGYNGGTWDGKGILSSSAATNTSAALGIARAEDIGLAGGTFGNVPVAAGDVLVAYTLAGDANLDSKVDFEDLVRLAQNYNTSGKFWSQGDFNYDGNVAFEDLVKLAQNYNTSLPAGAIPGAPMGFEADWAEAMAMAPEPGGLLMAVGVISVLFPSRGRRRKRR